MTVMEIPSVRNPDEQYAKCKYSHKFLISSEHDIKLKRKLCARGNISEMHLTAHASVKAPDKVKRFN